MRNSEIIIENLERTRECLYTHLSETIDCYNRHIFEKGELSLILQFDNSEYEPYGYFLAYHYFKDNLENVKKASSGILNPIVDSIIYLITSIVDTIDELSSKLEYYNDLQGRYEYEDQLAESLKKEAEDVKESIEAKLDVYQIFFNQVAHAKLEKEIGFRSYDLSDDIEKLFRQENVCMQGFSFDFYNSLIDKGTIDKTDVRSLVKQFKNYKKVFLTQEIKQKINLLEKAKKEYKQSSNVNEQLFLVFTLAIEDKLFLKICFEYYFKSENEVSAGDLLFTIQFIKNNSAVLRILNDFKTSSKTKYWFECQELFAIPYQFRQYFFEGY